MRYGRLTDLGFTEAQIKAGFVPPEGKIGDTMTNAMRPGDAKAWFGALPPDLSVIARARGTRWLYTYLRGFYVDETKPTGWNNLVFKDVGMPHVMWQLSGLGRLVEKEYAAHGEAEAALAKLKGVAELVEKHEASKDGKETVKYVLRSVEAGKGAMQPDQYDSYVVDLVNFLDYLGEPAKNKRIAMGYVVLAFLLVLFVFAYLLKREFWKDVH
jgi:ubiquinol-cytochrome c reductase cytochrome c1 subunit